MTTESELSQSPEYDNPRRRRSHVFLLRHGEPVRYGGNTRLTDTGTQQINAFADYFIDRLKNDSGSKIVKILRSDRERSEETANIVAERLRHERKNLPFVQVVENVKKRQFISPENTLDHMVELGVPLGDAYEAWLCTEDEEMMGRGIPDFRSAKRVASEARDLVRRLDAFVREENDELRNGKDLPHLYYLLSTHETTLGATLMHMPPFLKTNIQFAEFLEVEGGRRDGCLVTFRGDSAIWPLSGLNRKIT